METLKTIWDFFQNEVLGMNWLNRLIETILNACGLDTTGKIGASIQFFIYDTIKIIFVECDVYRLKSLIHFCRKRDKTRGGERVLYDHR